MAEIKIGDVAVSTAGRDKGRIYLVIGTCDLGATVVNGRNVSAEKPKSKNFKHLKKASDADLSELALKIACGEPVGKERIFRALKKAAQTETDKDETV